MPPPSSMTSGTIEASDPSPGVRLIQIARPQALNAINMPLFIALETAFTAAERDDMIHVIILAGAGGRAFSAGFDIVEMAGFDADAMKAAFVRRDPFFWQVANCAKPVIAALDGVAYGAGALMALAADIRLASAALRFKITATSYGAANATWSLPPIVGPALAKELLFTARVVEGAEALAIGLVNRLVADGQVVDAAIEMAAQIAAHPQAGVRAAKLLVNAASNLSLQDACEAEFRWMESLFGPQQKGGGETFDGFLSARRRGPAGDRP